MQNIAIFGGSFNPPHLAHSAVIPHIQKLNLLKTIIVPSLSWQKNNLISSSHRIQMCKLAFQGLDFPCSISEYDISNNNLYSINTIKHFHNIYNQKLLFIIGYDQLVNLHTWHKWKEIFDYAKIYVLNRKIDRQTIDNEVKLFEKDIIIDNWNTIDISSTFVRNIIKQKKYNIAQKYLHKNVLEYIISNSLYLN